MLALSVHGTWTDIHCYNMQLDQGKENWHVITQIQPTAGGQAEQKFLSGKDFWTLDLTTKGN